MGLGYYSGYDAQTMGDAADRIEELEATLQESRIHFEQITDGARVDDDLLERIEVVLGMRDLARAPTNSGE